MTDAPVLARYFDTRFQLEAIKILPGQCYAARRDVMIVTDSTSSSSRISVMTPRASRCAGRRRVRFMPSRYHARTWNWNDEPPSRAPVRVEIVHDLIGEIPREDEQIVGRILLHALDRDHGDVHARRI